MSEIQTYPATEFLGFHACEEEFLQLFRELQG